MKIYEVGGCVRDRILGLEPKDIDYVVVGSSEKDMLALGYEQVGKDFPVFLNPLTKSEYALARKERKTCAGYQGFITETENVTLEEDLFRRDLTINAIAMSPEGHIIDPYEGKKDLDNKILRHVSDHFKEDPVRILRIARFSARYNFEIAPETYLLMQDMVQSGEFDALTKERVWKEFEKALKEPYLQNFFTVLEKINALEKIFSFNQLKEKEFFDPNNNFEQNLCHVFSQCTQQELKQWKMPENEQQLITIYKKYMNDMDLYISMTAENKLEFITLTNAMHNIKESINMLSLCFSYQKRDFKDHAEKLQNDIELLKGIDYPAFIETIINKKDIKKEVKALKLKTLSSPKLKPRFG